MNIYTVSSRDQKGGETIGQKNSTINTVINIWKYQKQGLIMGVVISIIADLIVRIIF